MLSRIGINNTLWRSIKRTVCDITSNPDATYEARKAAKRSLKIGESFKVADANVLIEHTADTYVLVPNFFTSQLNIRKFPPQQTNTHTHNQFLNSYLSLTLPLSQNERIREKLNKLFDKQVRLGRIFELMDSVAGMVSYAHCFSGVGAGKSAGTNMFCVTGSVESLHLFERIDISKDLTVEGYLNAVGKTSMEIQINVLQEDRLKSNSIFTMIARDANRPAKGYPVPALSFDNLTPEQLKKAQIRLAAAKENAVRRKAQMDNSYDKKPPISAQIDEIHQLFLHRKGSLTAESTPISESAVTSSQVMHTQERNLHGKIFGGFLIRQMIEVGWVTACKQAGDYMILEDVTNIYFKRPVDVGCRLTLKAQVTYIENKRMVITVEAYTAKFTEKQETLACYLHLVAKGNAQMKPVHPESYEEALQYLSSRKAYCELFY